MLHPEINKIAKALKGTEFENRAWLVGGAVRDEMMGKQIGNDLDIVVQGDSAKAAQILWEKKIATIAPVTYPRFKTAMVQVGGIDIEFASARKESYQEDSRKPNVENATIKEDATRRDFTCNTLMRDLFTGELVDPLGTGESDLKNKLLRTPRDPAETFFDDPLRMLRAVRFRWQLSFDPVPGLYDAIRQEAKRLKIISAERIRDELTKMLSLVNGHKALSDLMDLNLLDQFAPEFRAGVGMMQGPYHHLDVWDHTLAVVENTDPADLTLRLAAWMHDVAKPDCKRGKSGRITFKQHEVVGAEMTMRILKRLKFSLKTCEESALLVRHHMRLLHIGKMSDAAARRVWRDLGDQTEQLLSLCEADSAAHKPGVKRPDLRSISETLSRVAILTPPSKLKSPISGERIMEITGLEQGSGVGKVKRHLSEMVIEGALDPDDHKSAEAAAINFLGNQKGEGGV